MASRPVENILDDLKRYYGVEPYGRSNNPAFKSLAFYVKFWQKYGMKIPEAVEKYGFKIPEWTIHHTNP